jgi:AcrR family transcriptional regulator
MAPGSDRRTTILNHAAKLFAEKGVAASTVREIADSVGMLSGSLYHHFESKASMVEAIMTSYLDDLRDRSLQVVASTSDPRACLQELVRASYSTIGAHPYATEIYQNDANYLRTLKRYPYIRSAAAEVQKCWISVIENGVHAGVLREDIPPQVFYRLMRDAVWLSVRWFKPTRDYPMSRLAEDCVSVFLDGFAAGRRTTGARNRSRGVGPATRSDKGRVRTSAERH